MNPTAMETRQATMAAMLARAPVIAVVSIEDPADAVPLAGALVRGGIPVIEVTLRTALACEAIRCIATEVDGAIVGAGTVLAAGDFDRVAAAGARFAVSPGHTAALLDAAETHALPFLPGAATASDVMRLRERGYRHAKCFPAAAVGGVALLRAWHGPLADMRFCPTGGVTVSDAAQYLALPNVACVGGSWLTPAGALREKAWARVEALAREAAALMPAAV